MLVSMLVDLRKRTEQKFLAVKRVETESILCKAKGRVMRRPYQGKKCLFSLKQYGKENWLFYRSLFEDKDNACQINVTSAGNVER